MKQVLQIVGIMFGFIAVMIAFALLFSFIPDIPYAPVYAVALLAVSSTYLIYRLLQVCITGIPLNSYEDSLTFVTYFLWLDVSGKLGDPFSGIIMLGLGLLGIFFILFYLHKHSSKVKHKTIYMVGLAVFALFVFFGSYHLITDHKVIGILK